MRLLNKTKILSEFRLSIRCGTGRSFLLMKQYPEINFANEIYKASIKNYAYDGQSEESRILYLEQFLNALNKIQTNNFKRKIVARLFEEKEDSWNLQQIFNICGYFAKTDLKVKKAIYKRFKQTPIKDSDWLGTTAILKLDGTKGMIKIAEYFGEKLIKDKDDWQDDWIVNDFDEEHPEVKIMQVLKKEAQSNQYIKKYLDEIEDTRKSSHKNTEKRIEWSIETVINHLLDDTKRKPPISRIKQLKKKELKQIIDLFKPNLSQTKIEKFLYIFTYIKYPNNYEDLKVYLNIKYPEICRQYAYEALSFISNQEIRAIAINKLKTSRTPSVHTDILKSNYKNGDSKLITRIINKFKDEHIIEKIAISLCKVYEKNATVDCKEPLLALYYKMNCAIHRNSVLEILNKNKVLPNSVLKEMAFDCHENTRILHKTIKQND